MGLIDAWQRLPTFQRCLWRIDTLTRQCAGQSITINTAAQQHIGLNDAWQRAVALSMRDSGLQPPSPLSLSAGGTPSPAHTAGRAPADPAAVPLEHACLPEGYAEEVASANGGDKVMLIGPAGVATGETEQACREVVSRLFIDADATCPQPHECGAMCSFPG